MSPAAKTADVIIVEPGDRRLAMCGLWPGKAALYEQADDADPVYIVVTCAANDERLVSLAHRFHVEPSALINFRDALASAVSQ